MFGPDADWWHNAVVSKWHSSWYVYAEGYRRAADALAEVAAADRGENDALVYPIVFLYRQYLELSFKGMLRDAAFAAGAEPPGIASHSLPKVWATLQPLLKDALDQDLKAVEWQILTNCVDQFAKSDPTSQTFRYPVQKDGAPADHVTTHINLRQLRDEMANAHLVIDCIWNYLVVRGDLRQEMLDAGMP